jgi:hypothetical protein
MKSFTAYAGAKPGGETMNRPHQRKGARSNAHVGRAFEAQARRFFAGRGLRLDPGVRIAVGISGKKDHAFDLGNLDRKVVVECKSHKWTESGNVPSAKMMAWNEAMFLFHAAPKSYRKIMFVLRDYSRKRKETLARYYIRTYAHLIPEGVEIWEFGKQGERLR